MPLIGTASIGSLLGTSCSVSDSDAQAYIDGLTGTYTPARLCAIHTFVAGLKSNSLWTRFDRMYLGFMATEADSLRCLKSLTSATTESSSEGAFRHNAFQDWDRGRLVSYNASVSGVQYTLNSAHTATNITAIGADRHMFAESNAGFTFGAAISNSFARRTYLNLFPSGVSEWPINQGYDNEVAFTVATGLYVISRLSNSNSELSRNGSSITTSSASSSEIPNDNIRWGFTGGYRADFASTGGSLTTSQASTLKTLLDTLKASFA